MSDNEGESEGKNEKNKKLHPFFVPGGVSELKKKKQKSASEKRSERKEKDAERYAAAKLKKESEPVLWDTAYKTGRPWLFFEEGMAYCSCKFIEFSQLPDSFIL